MSENRPPKCGHSGSKNDFENFKTKKTNSKKTFKIPKIQKVTKSDWNSPQINFCQKTDPPKCGHSGSKNDFENLETQKTNSKKTFKIPKIQKVIKSDWNSPQIKFCQKTDPPKCGHSGSKNDFENLETQKTNSKKTFKIPKIQKVIKSDWNSPQIKFCQKTDPPKCGHSVSKNDFENFKTQKTN